MKILFFDAGSYTYWDILAAFKEMGHSCKTVYYHFKDRYEDAFFEERMEQYLTEAVYKGFGRHSFGCMDIILLKS